MSIRFELLQIPGSDHARGESDDPGNHGMIVNEGNAP